MPRTARKNSNSNIYHIILRGVNHRTIFEEDSDYQLFLYTLKFYKNVCEYEIIAYCIMSNHIHLLMKFTNHSISDSMKKIEDKFIWWYNQKYNRCGHLFQERFKSEPVENDSYLLTVFRYIHQNPVKANIVQNAGDYKWSSYNDYLTNCNELVSTNFMLNHLGNIESLLTYVNEVNEDICMENVKQQISDSDIIELIKKENHYNSINELCFATPNALQDMFIMLWKHGASFRQISRITGFSRKTITKYCMSKI